MSQNLKKTVLLVDYENVQSLDLSAVQEKDIDIKIFVGQSQSKIPIDLVLSTQQFGQRVEWIKIEGTGSNALDFHIAYYLGKFSSDAADISFLILSKDKGFDPLIKHLHKSKIKCRRIPSLLELTKSKTQERKAATEGTEPLLRVVCILSKMAENSRPRTRKSLHQHIKSMLIQKKPSDQAIETLVNDLFVQKKIAEVDDRLTYNF